MNLKITPVERKSTRTKSSHYQWMEIQWNTLSFTLISQKLPREKNTFHYVIWIVCIKYLTYWVTHDYLLSISDARTGIEYLGVAVGVKLLCCVAKSKTNILHYEFHQWWRRTTREWTAWSTELAKRIRLYCFFRIHWKNTNHNERDTLLAPK